jgi:cytochrome c oxidase assembly protein subunit 15
VSSLTVDSPQLPGQSATTSVPQNLALRVWLWSLAALVFLLVIVGGATRLTESGLSITEWKPLTGIVPPLNQMEWQAEFNNYKQIRQFAEVFPNMDLDGFKFIFFWEWSHRLLGRLIGLATFLPLIFFWATGALPHGLKAKLIGLLGLIGFQGFIGWWMVTSGLSGRIEVAQERLAIHLLLASITFAVITWIAASVNPRRPKIFGPTCTVLRIFAGLTIFALLLQISLGGLVAGLRAGRAFNTWPLIDGEVFPSLEKLTLLTPLWRNVLDNLLMVQFQHRLMAYMLVLLCLLQALIAWLLLPATRPAKRALVILFLVSAQAAIGIVTLVLVVPLWAGLLHQAFAIIVLGMATVHAQALSKRR